MLTPERERELAEQLAREVIRDVMPNITYTDARLQFWNLSEVAELPASERYPLTERIAELARTATVTVTIPSGAEEASESE